MPVSGMRLNLELLKVGNSIGVILPKEVLAHLDVVEGDSIVLTEGANGTLLLRAADTELRRQMEIARDVVRRYSTTLGELAK